MGEQSQTESSAKPQADVGSTALVGGKHGSVSRPYSAWFGKGDTKDDVSEVVKQLGEPLEVLLEDGGYMACLIYADLVVVVGFDGDEYCHRFEFPRPQKPTPK